MAAIDFPNSPANNDTFSSAGKNWFYNGYAWTLVGVSVNLPVEIIASNLDGGTSSSNYGGISPIEGGSA